VGAKQTDKTPPVGEWVSSADRSAELAPPITDGLMPRSAPLPEHEGTLYFAFPHSDLPIEFQKQLLSAVRTVPGNMVLLAKRQGNTVFELHRDSANALVYHHWNPSFGERRIAIPVADALREDLRGLILTVAWSPDKSVFSATAVYNDGTSDKREGVAFSRDKLLLVERTLFEFAGILATEGREEEAHQFLKANPILLGLTSSIEPVSKLKLGDDYVTDFVIREQGDGYVFVEIERPSMPLFKKGDPPERTADLNHAIEQIESWRSWVGRHHAYLATKLEGVSPDPLCWVIAGRRTTMAPRQVQRLEEINRMYRGVFRIFTYDDVADRVRNMLARVRASGHDEQALGPHDA
jgi:hypothetical protein